MMTGGLIDCHCHILPQIDDGAADLEESIEMARVASADGISGIIATPHIPSDGCFSPVDIEKRVAELNRQLVKHRVPVQIFPAAEVPFSLDPALFSQYTICHTRYVLIELPHDHLPSFAAKLLSRLCGEGLNPIIAHPERNSGVIRNPELFLAILHPGIHVQVTAGSMTGDFGIDAQICAGILLDSGKVDIIASDGHSARRRPPVLSKTVDLVSKRIGRQTALRLVHANPAAIIAGKSIHI